MAEADILSVDMAQAELAGGPAVEDDVNVRVGDRLRVARERLGLSRAELSLRTKINERHIEALEDSDFTALPARIYAVGFARSYAGAVGLDAARIAAEVRRELTERENPPARPSHQLDIDDPNKVPSRLVMWLCLALAAALILAGTIFWRSYFVPAVELPAVSDEVTQAAADPVPELSPSALISPTAESVLPLVAAQSATMPPTVQGAAAAAPTRSAAPAPRSIVPATQALPAPVPEALEPIPTATAAAAD